MFILSSISRGLGLWSVNHTSIYESSESNVFKNIKFLGDIFFNLPDGLFGTNVYKTIEFCRPLLLATLRCIITTSEISK